MSGLCLEVQGLCVSYPAPHGRSWWRRAATVKALDGVSLRIAPGEAYGLVGESGSGKTTLARCVAGLQETSAGSVRVQEQPVRSDSLAARRALGRRVQYVHQNPRTALNPRLPVGRIVAGPLESLHGLGREEREAGVRSLLARIGLDTADAARRPHAFSGGQAQRIAIARALAAEPALLVLDEPTSALDVRVQAALLRLLAALREETNVALLFISHDLPVVASLCSRVGVLRGGRLVEEGPREQVLAAPRNAYTRELLASVPRLEVA